MGDKSRREIEEFLARECKGLSAVRTIAHLMDCGLISSPASRAYMARCKVKELVKKGYTKMDAMEIVANQMGSTFATMKNYLYHNYK